MPLPLLLLGAATFVGAVVTIDQMNEKQKHKERLRIDLDEPEPHIGDKEGAVKLPSEILTSNFSAEPVPGSIVCCSVFSAFDHTGIWLEDGLIVELHGTGLIKAVSRDRFLHNRSGNALFVACDSQGVPLVVEGTAQRAAKEVYNFRDYDVTKNNCHRFSWFCVTGVDEKISRFGDFNNAIARLHGKKVYWDKVVVN